MELLSSQRMSFPIGMTTLIQSLNHIGKTRISDFVFRSECVLNGIVNLNELFVFRFEFEKETNQQRQKIKTSQKF